MQHAKSTRIHNLNHTRTLHYSCCWFHHFHFVASKQPALQTQEEILTETDSCKNCIKGRFSDVDGYGHDATQTVDVACKHCKTGKWSDTLGALSESVCTNCKVFGGMIGIVIGATLFVDEILKFSHNKECKLNISEYRVDILPSTEVVSILSFLVSLLFQRLFSNFQLISTQNFLLFDFIQLESTITYSIPIHFFVFQNLSPQLTFLFTTRNSYKKPVSTICPSAMIHFFAN